MNPIKGMAGRPSIHRIPIFGIVALMVVLFAPRAGATVTLAVNGEPLEEGARIEGSSTDSTFSYGWGYSSCPSIELNGEVIENSADSAALELEYPGYVDFPYTCYGNLQIDIAKGTFKVGVENEGRIELSGDGTVSFDSEFNYVLNKNWASCKGKGSGADVWTSDLDESTLDIYQNVSSYPCSPMVLSGSFKLTDTSGNPVEIVDDQPPDTTITSGPAGPVKPANVSFEFTSTDAHSKFKCAIDGGSFVDCSSPKSYKTLGDGPHTSRAMAVDGSGNSDPTPAERSFTVDSVAPSNTIDSRTPTYTGGETWPVTFSSDDEDAWLMCSLDGKPFSVCASPHTLPSGLSSGWHSFKVRAHDIAANYATPAEWTFKTSIYPDAPSTSMLISPKEGYKSSSHYTLMAQWGEPPPSGGVTGVTFQAWFDGWEKFETIPAKYVTDTQGEQVSWPLPASGNPGVTDPVFVDMKRWVNDVEKVFPAKAELNLRFRAVFDGGEAAAGASKPVVVDFDRHSSAPTNATGQVGPLTVDLLSGQATLSRTDVSIPVPGSDATLEFSRTYDQHSLKVPTKVLGSAWQPSLPVELQNAGQAWIRVIERHENAVPPQYDSECLEEEGTKEECEVESEIPAADWVDLLDGEGNGWSFDRVGSTYVSPEYAKDYTLTKSGESFALVDANGTKTIFEKDSTTWDEYQVKSTSWQSSPKSARMVYEAVGSELRLKMLIAPSALGVTCSDLPAEPDYAPTTPGCRTLTFQYDSGPTSGNWDDRLVSITYHNASGSGSQVVAKYAYDEESIYNDRPLKEVWDPRISPGLKEKYTYKSGGDLKTLTSPGEEPWEFTYYSGTYNKLKSAKRASLLESPTVAETTIVYGLPVSGESAPYDMSASAVGQWGQVDYPVNAAAIFPPDQVPEDDSPSDYSRASVFYMDPDGYLVNKASAAPPEIEGDVIETFETDSHGNVVRSLSAQNRLVALSDEDSAGRSKDLETKRTYSADGTEILEEWSPLREMELESGETVEARAHRTVAYDEGAPTPPAGTPMPHLPTKEIVGARVPGQSSDQDKRETRFKYDWDLRLQTETIVDPEGLNRREKAVFDSSTGLPIERSMPSNLGGGGAGTTTFRYYTAGAHPADSSCGNKPAWANLPCKTLPAGQPSGANPKLLVTRYAAYSALDQPTSVIDSPGGEESESKRTTTITYDAAGRTIKRKLQGAGYSIPATELVYSSTTGRAIIQRFVCEAPEECSKFDNQELISTYDTLGRQIAYQDADGNVSETAYDLLGRPAITSDGKGMQTITYDAESGLPVQMADSAAGTFTAEYDADRNMTEYVLPNGLAAQTTYDEVGTPVHLRYQKVTNCSSGCTWLEFDVQESVHGQWLKHTGSLSTQQFAYDKSGRLILAKDTPSGEGCTTRSYTYDADSNRTKLVTRAPGEGGACDTKSSGTTANYSYDEGDRLIGEGVAYDDFGRITGLPSAYAGGGTLTSSYYSNNLTRSQTQDGLTNTFELDSGLRQRRIVQSGSETGSETLHYSGGSDAPAWIEHGSSWTRNVVGMDGALAAIEEDGGEVTLQLTNLHGDVVATAALDQYATSLASAFEADEFGNPKGAAAPQFGWLGASQRRTTLPSGAVQMGVRTYVPAIGRFTSPDPIPGGSANAYEYSYGDPVNQFDLDGRASSGTACFHGVGFNCTCGFEVKMTSRRRGRMRIRMRMRCLRVGTIKVGGYTKYERHKEGSHCLGPVCDHFESWEPRFVNTGPPKLEPKATAPADAGREWDFAYTVACEPGREYQILKMHQVMLGLGNKGGQTVSKLIKVQEHCSS